jgi:hypothetical protein
MTNWLIRINNGIAYVYQRKFWMGAIAVPWVFTGGTNIVFTPDSHDDVLKASMEYILLKDLYANMQINFQPWS